MFGRFLFVPAEHFVGSQKNGVCIFVPEERFVLFYEASLIISARAAQYVPLERENNRVFFSTHKLFLMEQKEGYKIVLV